MKNPVDPRATRRIIPIAQWRRNSALYAKYEVVSYDGPAGAPTGVVLQLKLAFCQRPAGVA